MLNFISSRAFYDKTLRFKARCCILMRSRVIVYTDKQTDKQTTCFTSAEPLASLPLSQETSATLQLNFYWGDKCGHIGSVRSEQNLILKEGKAQPMWGKLVQQGVSPRGSLFTCHWGSNWRRTGGTRRGPWGSGAGSVRWSSPALEHCYRSVPCTRPGSSPRWTSCPTSPRPYTSLEAFSSGALPTGKYITG